MSADASKLKVPILVVVGLLSAVATFGGTWAVAADRSTADRARVQRLESKDETKAAEIEALRLRTQRLEDAFVNQNEMVKEIRQDVKDLKRR
jgi:hypothetical protein